MPHGQDSTEPQEQPPQPDPNAGIYKGSAHGRPLDLPPIIHPTSPTSPVNPSTTP